MLFLKVLNGKEKDVFQSARILSSKKLFCILKKKTVKIQADWFLKFFSIKTTDLTIKSVNQVAAFEFL